MFHLIAVPNEPRVLKKTVVKEAEKKPEGEQRDQDAEVLQDDSDSEWETDSEEEEEEEVPAPESVSQEDGVVDPRTYFKREGRFVHERDSSPEPSELDVVSSVTLLVSFQIITMLKNFSNVIHVFAVVIGGMGS